MLRILPEDHVSLTSWGISFVCGLWQLLSIVFILKYHIYAFSPGFSPEFHLIIFPFLPLCVGVLSIILNLSVLGILAVILNLIAVLMGKSTLLIALQLISK